MLYAAKCYWPGVRRADLDVVAARLAQLPPGFPDGDLVYRGSLMFAEDELVLCLFDCSSRAAVKRVSEQVGIPCERVMDSVWLDPRPAQGGFE